MSLELSLDRTLVEDEDGWEFEKIGGQIHSFCLSCSGRQQIPDETYDDESELNSMIDDVENGREFASSTWLIAARELLNDA